MSAEHGVIDAWQADGALFVCEAAVLKIPDALKVDVRGERIYVYMYACIYIYVENVYLYIYIINLYIYIHTYIMYIYIYIYGHPPTTGTPRKTTL